MKYNDIKITLRTMSLRVIVCTTFLVVFYWIGFPNLLFAESENETTENKMLFGFYKEVSGEIDLNVLCNIGIEQWEDNIKSENIVHVWEITLSNDTNTDFYMDLHVERYALLGNDTSIVNSFEVNTINKLLTIDKLDFEEGIFRFRFKFTETSNDVVFVNIRFITENNILYLN